MKSNEFLKIADILSKSHKIVVKEGKGWAANIQKREVFYRKADIYNLQEDHILGLLLHEIAHIHYTTEVDLPKKDEELMHSVMNMLEDISIEHIISSDYPNAGEILESTETELLDTLVRMLPKMHNMALHEKAILYGAIRFRGRGYEFGWEPYEKLGDEISAIMEAREKEILERKQTKDLMPLAQDIVDLLIKQLGQPTEDQKKQMKKDALAHTHATTETQNSEAERKTIAGLGGGGYAGEKPMEDPKAVYIDKIGDQADEIGKKLRTVMKRNNAMQYGGRYRTGKLMTKRIIRTRTNKDRRPFGRRIVKSNQSYAFAIASDVSGSMWNGGSYGEQGGNNGDYALTSMAMVSEALRKARIPRAMIIFGGRAQLVAPMGRKAIRWSELASEASIKKAKPSNTDIAEAIKACTKELKKVRAERKIMVILTDGSSDYGAMVRAHKEAEKEEIECIAITIGSRYNSMDNIFKDKKNFLIEDTRNTALIGKAFIELLSRAITDGGPEVT